MARSAAVPPDPEDHGSEGKRRVRILPYALYCSSIIIGAGILTLPVLVAKIGLGPAVVLTVGLGLVLRQIYVRIARSIYGYVDGQIQQTVAHSARILREADVGPVQIADLADKIPPEEAQRKGIGLLDEICAWLGFGGAGRLALVVGLLAYVIPACIGYVSVGAKTLTAIAGLATQQGIPIALPLSIGLAVAVASFGVPRVLPYFPGRAALAAILQMSAAWTISVVLLMLFPPSPWAPPLLFALGTASLVFRSSAEGDQLRSEGLSAVHRVGSLIAIVEIILLAATAGFALYTLWPHQALITPALVAPGFNASEVATACGLLLFAYTGTGIFNLIRYPHLFGGRGRRAALLPVVSWGTMIPVAAYVGWIVVIAVCVSPSALIAADRARSYPTIPLAQTVARLGGPGWVVVAAGLFVALLAVTGACMGFSESLADRMARLWGRAAHGRPTTHVPSPGAARVAQLLVLAFATAVAIALAALPADLAFSDLLSVAGTIGGGMLLLELPLFIPTRGRRHGRKWEIALATIIPMVLVAMTLPSLPAVTGRDPVNTVIAVAIIIIDIAFIGAVLALIAGEADAVADAAISASGADGAADEEAA